MSDVTLSDVHTERKTSERIDDPITVQDWATAIIMVAGGFAVWGLLGLMFSGGLPGA
ncbi:hypothetical protein [Ponticaulis sp.]|uniref:hypothetical protein n=1 Tax=Ponticaulis sp. TaxID=2020902 RepID=UPI002615EC46|nr:hypothetical protein [Ponticaulis sp.]MDF1680376.1 hypothetical protein [Ponticaulis sp.]